MRAVVASIFLCVLAGFVSAQSTGPIQGGPAGGGIAPEPAAGKKKLVLPAEKRSPVKIPLIETSPVIDGKVDEEIWKSAAVFKDFYQTTPGDNVEPSKPTEAYVVYDRENLYVAFKCWDEPDKIRASVAKRDEVFSEDNVRVWLDTFNDRRRAYILGFNPFGIQQDGIFTEGGEMRMMGPGGDFSVDIVMESKGVIESWGWSVEVKIPFRSLRYASGKGKIWGFNVGRNIDRLNDEMNQWMPDDKSVAGTLIKHGRITGLDEIKTERTIEVVPSVTLSETGSRVPTIPESSLTGLSVDPGRFVNAPIRKDVGVTLKYTITPNVVLDAAINPDFAEIEADAQVVTTNQRFPIFFEEKRPFFLEGADIFKSPINIFYSRTIVDPDAAVKLSGKTGKTTFGFLAAVDKAPGNYSESDRNEIYTRPAIDEFLDKRAYFGVVRLKRDFGTENSIGVYATARSFPEQKNFVAGFDARVKISPRTVATFQVVGSNSKRCFFDGRFEPLVSPFQASRNQQLCGGGTFNGITVSGSSYRGYRTGNGFAYDASYDFTEKNYGFYAKASGRSKFYRADAGFTRRTDTNQVMVGGRISSEANPTAKLIRVSWFNSVESNFDFNGRPQLWMYNARFSFQLAGNANAGLWTGVGNEHLYEDEFGLSRMPSRPTGGAFYGAAKRGMLQQWIGGNVNKRFSKQVGANVNFKFVNNEPDFDFGGGSKFPRVSPAALLGSSQLDPGPGTEAEIKGGFDFKPIEPFRLSFELSKQRLRRKDTGRIAFDSKIASLRSTYQFSRFLFTRIRVDYNSISSSLNGQFLFGYTPGPGTAFYVGYNDSLNYNGYNPFTGQYEPGVKRSSRTFFIRASYLFRRSF